MAHLVMASVTHNINYQKPKSESCKTIMTPILAQLKTTLTAAISKKRLKLFSLPALKFALTYLIDHLADRIAVSY